jgi:hypothetical protein
VAFLGIRTGSFLLLSCSAGSCNIMPCRGCASLCPCTVCWWCGRQCGNIASLLYDIMKSELATCAAVVLSFGPCQEFRAVVCFIFMNILFTACNWDQIKKVPKLPNPKEYTALWISFLHNWVKLVTLPALTVCEGWVELNICFCSTSPWRSA